MWYTVNMSKNIATKISASGISLGSVLALVLSIHSNAIVNEHSLTFAGQVFWVFVNTLCSWFYVISYFVTHAFGA
jgi:hypothetical protein